jgi:pimeloyl-ACP methyl ester carboxylesterase
MARGPHRVLPPQALLAVAVGLESARRARARALLDRRGERPVTVADDGVELHVEVAGRDDADLCVVLVHGYGASLQEWRRQRDALAPHARLVLYDQRGHGCSGWGHHRRATLRQLGRDLLAVVEAHGRGQPVVLVAHSMGGMAVLALAGSHPQLFGSAIVGVALLSASAGHLLEIGVPGLLARALRRARALSPALWLLWFAAPLLDRTAPFATAPGRRVLRRRLFGRHLSDEGDLDAAQRHFVATRTSVLAAFAPALLHHDRAGALEVLTGVPVLVLSGAEDATIPAAHSCRIARELAGRCELVVVPGAGHMVNVTSAQVVDLSGACCGTPLLEPPRTVSHVGTAGSELHMSEQERRELGARRRRHGRRHPRRGHAAAGRVGFAAGHGGPGAG